MSVRALALLAAGALAGGCISVGQQTSGNPVRWDRAAAIEPGSTTLSEALLLLGAPDQMQRHPDGLMLMWRRRAYDYSRLGIEPDRLISFIPTSRVVATVLSNFSLVIEDGVEREDRLALLVGPDNLVAGIGMHRAIP